MKNENRGITLVALVVTIIVLIILAGVSISLVLGENGIITKVKQSKQETLNAQVDEQEQLNEVAAYLETLGETTNDPLEILEKGTLPSSDTTKPYYPGEEFFKVKGTDLNTGLVVTDKTNYWTWIEVPKTATIYNTATLNLVPDSQGLYTEAECIKIEADLIDYITTQLLTGTGDYRTTRTGEDVWHDKYGATYNEELEYCKVGFTNYTQQSEFKSRYGTIYSDEKLTQEVTSMGVNTNYYVSKNSINLEDIEGCGLSYTDYNNLKRKMLSSVYTNGGFWIGQYEMGANEQVVKNDKGARIPVCKKGAIVYNYVTCSQAQKLSENINSGNRTSSLLFGLQWDLVLMHLKNKGVDTSLIIENANSWGNYKDSEFTIDNGKFTTTPTTANSYQNYTETKDGYIENKTKLSNSSVLLTTGASKRNSKMNIYDLSGNVSEWTLEYTNITYHSGSYRGTTYNHSSKWPASTRAYGHPIGNSSQEGFRAALY